MLLMPSNFFSLLRQQVAQVDAPEFVPVKYDYVELPVHPSASELMEQMLVDPEALRNETYEPGIYDEDGDYYPQFSDDPLSLPDYIAPNPLDSGDAVPAPEPASDSQPSESSSVDSEKE